MKLTNNIIDEIRIVYYYFETLNTLKLFRDDFCLWLASNFSWKFLNCLQASPGGDLLLSISYLTKAQRLIVTVIKARNLPPLDDKPGEKISEWF